MSTLVYRNRPGSNRVAHPIRASLPGGASSAADSLAELLSVDGIKAGPLPGAACASLEDPDLMFPHPGDSAGAKSARTVCAACPVKAECLDRFGDLPFGVVAGMTVSERRAQRRAARDASPQFADAGRWQA